MKNSTKSEKAIACYNAILNNITLIEAMCNRVGADSYIIELMGVEADSQIASVLSNTNDVLTANHNAGSGVYDQAAATYVVSVNSYTTNTAFVAVEVARLDFSYFLTSAATNWAAFSGGSHDAEFQEHLLDMHIQLQQFKDSVNALSL